MKRNLNLHFKKNTFLNNNNFSNNNQIKYTIGKKLINKETQELTFMSQNIEKSYKIIVD
jgi:hypothetical protein